MPWELLDAPSFLKRVPRLLNPPRHYDEKGRPEDEDEDEAGAGAGPDEEAYTGMVRDAEGGAGADDGLSGMLVDGDARDLADFVHLYSMGKIGFYGRALDYFESRCK